MTVFNADRINLILTTPPTASPLTLTEIKAHCRIDDSDNDAVLTAIRDAAVGHLDPSGDGWLGLALCQQSWELRLNTFPMGERSDYTRDFSIVVPYPPLISIDSIKYYDQGGTLQTLPTSQYQVDG